MRVSSERPARRHGTRMRARVALSVALLGFGLAGCGEQTSGAATPPSSTEGGTPSDSASTEPGSPGRESGTADLQPCELLTGAELAQLGLGAHGVEDEIVGQRGCLWTASGSHTVTISIADDLGLADVVSSSPTRALTVGSHEAMQSTGGVSSCAINLGVTATSRVDVISSANGDEAKACDIAIQAAELVEPTLP